MFYGLNLPISQPKLASFRLVFLIILEIPFQYLTVRGKQITLPLVVCTL